MKPGQTSKPSRVPALVLAAALGCGVFAASVARAAEPVPAAEAASAALAVPGTGGDAQQPVRTVADIDLMLKDLVRQMADLSTYIDKVNTKDGTILLKEVVKPGANPICAPRTPRATLGKSVQRLELGKAESALDAANRSLAKGQAIKLKLQLSKNHPGC